MNNAGVNLRGWTARRGGSNPGKSEQSLENVELEPHVLLRHGGHQHRCFTTFTLVSL
jgi:hypothetical protein